VTLVLSLSLHQVRAKHVTAMMMQMLIAMAVTSVTWWLVGYSLAFGNSRSYGLIGDFSNACYLGVAEMTVLPGSTSPLTVPGVAYATFQVHLLHTYTPTIHLLHTYYTPTIHLLYTYYVVLYTYHTPTAPPATHLLVLHTYLRLPTALSHLVHLCHLPDGLCVHHSRPGHG